MEKKQEYLLVGDIGGTKTVLALFSSEQGPHHHLEGIVFPSAEYSSLEDIVKVYLVKTNASIWAASFGIAGPVQDNRVQATNVPWVVDSASLSSLLGGVPVRLLNDLQAIAYAVPHLRPSDMRILNSGIQVPHETIGVIAPGTGLGEAFLVWESNRYIAYPSEGGHVNFGPTNDIEIELLKYLMPGLGHVSYERVCSGIGIPNIYQFLRDVQKLPEPDWLKAELDSAQDPTPVIFRAALEKQVEICTCTLDLFISILASEAGNLALKTMALGGIYLGGGIPPRILPQLEEKSEMFMRAFSHKGRFNSLLMQIPVYVILHPHSALFGAACYAFDQGL